MGKRRKSHKGILNIVGREKGFKQSWGKGETSIRGY
jgi:hypothetical protein